MQKVIKTSQKTLKNKIAKMRRKHQKELKTNQLQSIKSDGINLLGHHLKSKKIKKIKLPELDIYDCYYDDKYLFTELNFSNNHMIRNNNKEFNRIVKLLEPYFYTKIDKHYAIINIYVEDISLHEIIDKFKIDTITGIKFLNNNHIPDTQIIFSGKKQITAHISSCDDPDTYSKIIFNNYSDLLLVKQHLQQLKDRFHYICNANVLLDRLMRYQVIHNKKSHS